MHLSEALSRDVYRTKKHLAALMHCTPREVEFQVEQARKRSELPILSGPDGYRLARNPEEYQLNVERRRKRALGQLVTVRGEREYIRKWRGEPEPPPRPAPKPRRVPSADQEALWQ